MADMTVTQDTVVVLDYNVTDAEGRLIDTSAVNGPLAYLHGHGNIVKGLEAALSGLAVGARLDIQLSAAEAYGDHDGREPISVPKREIPKGVPLEPGRVFSVPNAKGERVPLWIKQVVGGRVLVDTNHPLAGKALSFAVEILAIREATPAELRHGHAHGPSGTAHHH